MPQDDLYDDDEYEDDDDEPRGPAALRRRNKQMKDELRQSREELAELAGLRRRVAFVDAGLDTSDPKLSYFVKGYDGDLEPDAIKAAAVAAGFVAAPPADTSSGVPSQIAGAAAGANPEPSTVTGPKFVTHAEEYQDALRRAGMNQDAVLGVMREYGSPIADID